MKKKSLRWQNCSEGDLVRNLEEWVQEEGVRGLLDRTLIFLDGEMGVGKSTWVRHLFRLLNPTQEFFGSPTFPILHTYRADHRFGSIPLLHFDWYRITSESELKERGLDESFETFPALICVEWGDRCPGLRAYWVSKEAKARRSVWVVQIEFAREADLRNVTLSRAFDFDSR